MGRRDSERDRRAEECREPRLRRVDSRVVWAGCCDESQQRTSMKRLWSSMIDQLIAARASKPEWASHIDWARVHKWARLSKIRLRAKEGSESEQQERDCKNGLAHFLNHKRLLHCRYFALCNFSQVVQIMSHHSRIVQSELTHHIRTWGHLRVHQ